MDETEFVLGTKYDDPVGIWYECRLCNKQSFIPDFDESGNETDVFEFCSYCGRKITKIINT